MSRFHFICRIIGAYHSENITKIILEFYQLYLSKKELFSVEDEIDPDDFYYYLHLHYEDERPIAIEEAIETF